MQGRAFSIPPEQRDLAEPTHPGLQLSRSWLLQEAQISLGPHPAHRVRGGRVMGSRGDEGLWELGGSE